MHCFFNERTSELKKLKNSFFFFSNKFIVFVEKSNFQFNNELSKVLKINSFVQEMKKRVNRNLYVINRNIFVLAVVAAAQQRHQSPYNSTYTAIECIML